jgi:tRNA-modifying protein YgfZ
VVSRNSDHRPTSPVHSSNVNPPPGSLDLATTAAWAELPGRMTLLATGPAAVAFVDKFTTASLAALQPGHGTEGFFTDGRGWVIALANLLRTGDGLWIDAVAGPASRLRDHLEHYHIREPFEFVDADATVACHLVAGPDAARWLAARSSVPPPARLFDHATMSLGGTAAHVARIDDCGPDAWLVRVDAEDAAKLRDWFDAEGLPRASAAAIDAVRIESRYPAPADMPEKTLPQELDRTARAISFTKGCYLGQETVARLDALGHVNRSLAAVAVEGEPPAAGAVIRLGDDSVGTITSSCDSPRHGGAIGLALVHRRAADPAARLTVNGAAARLVGPPAASGSTPSGTP